MMEGTGNNYEHCIALQDQYSFTRLSRINATYRKDFLQSCRYS